MKGPLWIVVVLAGALGLGAGAAVRHWYVESPPASAGSEPGTGVPEAVDIVGARRPDFRLPDRDGESRSIGDFDGRVVLLNFWATWCPPCLEEIPALAALQESLGEQGLQVLGVALENPEAVREFAAEREIGYPLLVGDRRGFSLAREYGNPRGTLPYTVLIDRSGTVRSTHQGALTQEEARALVAPWL